MYIPADPRKPAEKVVVDGSNSISFYLHVSDGPVEHVDIPIPGYQDHALYVNARYMQLPESMINPRASVLFDNCGIGMAGGAIRGDALLIGVVDGSGYPASADHGLVAALT